MSNQSEYSKNWRKKNADHLRAYNKKYNEEHREQRKEYMRKWREKNRERVKSYKKQYEQEHVIETRLYRKTYSRKYYYNNLDKSREASRKWEKNNLKKLKSMYGYAHQFVRTALKNGILEKQCCEVCGNEEAEAHHDNYNEPLNVRWLCKECHDEWHRNNKPIYFEKGEM